MVFVFISTNIFLQNILCYTVVELGSLILLTKVFSLENQYIKQRFPVFIILFVHNPPKTGVSTTLNVMLLRWSSKCIWTCEVMSGICQNCVWQKSVQTGWDGCTPFHQTSLQKASIAHRPIAYWGTSCHYQLRLNWVTLYPHIDLRQVILFIMLCTVI